MAVLVLLWRSYYFCGDLGIIVAVLRGSPSIIVEILVFLWRSWYYCGSLKNYCGGLSIIGEIWYYCGSLSIIVAVLRIIVVVLVLLWRSGIIVEILVL